MSSFALRAQPVFVTNGNLICREELDMSVAELTKRIDQVGSTCASNHPASLFSGGTTESQWVENTIMAVRKELSSLQQSLLELSYDFNEFKNMIIEEDMDDGGDEEPAAKESKTEENAVELSKDEISLAQEPYDPLAEGI